MLEVKKSVSDLIDFDVAGANPDELFQWVKNCFIEVHISSELEKIIPNFKEWTLKQLELVDIKKMNNKEKAFLTHIILKLKVSSLEEIGREVFRNMLLGEDEFM